MKGITGGVDNTTVMLILNNIFNFQSGSHQSSRHNNSSLVIFANNSLGHDVILGPDQRLFCPVLTSKGLRHKICKTVPLA